MLVQFSVSLKVEVYLFVMFFAFVLSPGLLSLYYPCCPWFPYGD